MIKKKKKVTDSYNHSDLDHQVVLNLTEPHHKRVKCFD
jgi:hypothetical protein